MLKNREQRKLDCKEVEINEGVVSSRPSIFLSTTFSTSLYLHTHKEIEYSCSTGSDYVHWTQKNLPQKKIVFMNKTYCPSKFKIQFNPNMSSKICEAVYLDAKKHGWPNIRSYGFGVRGIYFNLLRCMSIKECRN